VQTARIGGAEPILFLGHLDPRTSLHVTSTEGTCERPGILSTPHSLPERILQAMASVDESQLRRPCEEFEYCVDVCRVVNGSRVEHL
jgi:hypothetical protein